MYWCRPLTEMYWSRRYFDPKKNLRVKMLTEMNCSYQYLSIDPKKIKILTEM